MILVVAMPRLILRGAWRPNRGSRAVEMKDHNVVVPKVGQAITV
jgi:hypothetical protein